MKETTEIEDLELRLSKVNDNYSKWLNGDTPEDFNQFQAESDVFFEEMEDINYQLLIIKPAVMKPLGGSEDLMTMEEFRECCERGMFIDYDGHGYYATKDQVSDKLLMPSHFEEGRYLKFSEFTHVVWYNK